MRTWTHKGASEGGFTMESDDGYLLSVHSDGSKDIVGVLQYVSAIDEYDVLGETELAELGEDDIEAWADEVIDGTWPETAASC